MLNEFLDLVWSLSGPEWFFVITMAYAIVVLLYLCPLWYKEKPVSPENPISPKTIELVKQPEIEADSEQMPTFVQKHH